MRNLAILAAAAALPLMLAGGKPAPIAPASANPPPRPSAPAASDSVELTLHPPLANPVVPAPPSDMDPLLRGSDNLPHSLGLTPKEYADSVARARRHSINDKNSIRRLTEDDFREVAQELGVEVAAIKAVVDIEAGRAHEGFYQAGKPIINFDLSMYTKFAPKRGVSLANARKTAPVIFNRPNTGKYGSYQAAQHARFEAARAINEESAIEGCFWGMFQIGGFNYKLCGCETPQEFVEKMSRSERDQLELFSALIKKCGMLESLQKKQWLAFALKYNGPRAKARGYHTRMAAAYARYS